MATNKTQPNSVSVSDFLKTLSEARLSEANSLITIMSKISGLEPVMWGPSIVGFGSKHYKYDTGREGDMAIISFSPRKSAITIYFVEGFDRYAKEMEALGKHKASVSCLYINKLTDIDLKVLTKMIKTSYEVSADQPQKASTVADYVASVPSASKPYFNTLRELAHKTLPEAQEVFSYGIVGYKVDDKRARVFISGWKDHVAIYPVPKDPLLIAELQPYIKSKGTIWLPLDKPLPEKLIIKTMKSLAK